MITDQKAPRELAISVAEAARRLGLSRASAYSAVASGALPSVRVGTRILVPLGALQRFLNRADAEQQ
jgi:excisionase family DNA binding protein